MDDYRIILVSVEESEWTSAGVNIEVLKKINNSADPELARYVSQLDEFVTPFSILDNTKSESELKLTEVIGPLNLNKVEYDISGSENIDQLLPSKIISKNEVDTTVSRGYCLNIPQIGSLLITHNADVIMKIRDNDQNNPTPKSLHIETPGQVILNPANAALLDLDIVSSATVISGEDKAILHSLTFRPIQQGNLMSGLFVDHNSLLSLANLKLSQSLLMVLGKLSIIEDCHIKGGYIFNMGTLNMLSSKNEIKNCSYFFNGTIGQFESYKITINVSAFSNLGKILVNTATITTEKAFDNQGEISPTVKLNIEGQSEVFNRGDIKNTNGCLKISNPAFFHYSGEINMSKCKFFSNSNRIQSTIKADKVTFKNSTLLKHFNKDGPDVEIRDLSVNGVFINEGNMKLIETLRTFGDHTEIHNRLLITTQLIANESDEALIQEGEVEATKIQVKTGSLHVKSVFKSLNSVEIDTNGKLFIPKENKTPNLKWIKSKGKLRIENDVSSLVSIESDKTSHIQIDSNIELNKIVSFNKMSGQTDFVNVKFKNVKVFDLPPYANMTFYKNSKIYNIETIIVRENASLIFEESTIYLGLVPKFLIQIYNFGLFVSKTPLFNIASIYNGKDAELVLLEETNVDGRKLVSNDSKYINISKYSNLIDDAMKKANKSGPQEKMIGVFNEGRLLVKQMTRIKEKSNSNLGDIGSFFLCTPSDENDPETKDIKRKGLRIKSNYVSSKDAQLKLDEYAIISAKDFINYGTIYSPHKIRIDETSNLTRIGIIGSEHGIDYNIGPVPVCLNETFVPIVNSTPKVLNIKSMSTIEFIDNINIDIHVNIEAAKLFFKGNLTTQSLIAKTTEFHIDKNDREKNEIASKENFEIYTEWFMNHCGILKTQDEQKKSKIICSQLFQNTGAGEFSEDHKKITYFTMGNRRSDVPHLDKAGLIATGGFLEIKAKTIDNCFGIVNGISGLSIESQNLINNECGLILSTGKTNLKGLDIDNGRVQLDPVFNDCNVFNLKSGSIPSYFIKRNRNGYYDKNTTNPALEIAKYQGTQSTPITIYPGYIFSKGDLTVEMSKPCYIGTLVSENDIYFRGQKVLLNSVNEMGTLIARGDIKAEFKNAQLEQFNIQARNIALKTVEKLKLEGIIHSFDINGEQIDIIDLVKFGNYLGYLSKQETFRKQGDTRMSIGKIISTVYGPSQEVSFNAVPTKDAGFIGRTPKGNFFMSTIQNSILNQLIRLTLTPFKGRDILLRIDLINELRKTGSNLLDSATNSRSIILKEGDPALVFQEVRDQEVEMEINGEKVKVPLCNPYLIMSSVTRMISKMKAEKRITLQSMNDIEVLTGNNNLEMQDLNLEAEGQVIITSQYKYSGGRKVGVNLTDLKIPGEFTVSGKSGILTKGVSITATGLTLKSEHGDIIDFDMPLDMVFNYDMPYHDWWTITGHQDTHSSLFQAQRLGISTNNKIIQHGTNIIAGQGGVTIEADSYHYEPSYIRDYVYQQRHRQTTRIETRMPKQGGIISAGNVIFKTKNATLIGATIIAPKLSNPTDGNFRLLPAYIDQHIWSRETKKNFWGSSSVEFDQYRHIPVGCTILTHNFEMLGTGTLEMEGVTAKIVNATILKNIEERAAYETSHTVITQSSSGFCPPKINGDCFINSINNVAQTLTCFEDAAAAAFGIIGGLCQTVNDLTILSNLSTINNPMLSIAQIFLSRFVTSFTFCNVKTTTTIDAKIPYQSHFDIDVLRVSNDRTHLEGNWCIKEKGVFETKEFETKAPEHSIHQHTETSGYCISLSPGAILGACLCPNPMTLGACLPNVSVFTSEQDIKSKEHEAQVLTADDLFIRCDNAVFSGSTIEARLVECIVSGDLKIEDLTNEFISESHSSNFSVNLAGIFAIVQSMTASSQSLEQWREAAKEAAYQSGEAQRGILADSTFLDPRWKGIPQIRIASEKTIRRSVQNLASFCGREKFVLKVAGLLHMKNALVGLTPPDGIVVNPENREEVIEAGRVLNEKIQETYVNEKKVFRPCVSEFVQMMASYQSMQQTFEDIEIANYEKELREGRCVRDAKIEAKAKTKNIMRLIDSLDEKGCKVFIDIIKIAQQNRNKSKNDGSEKVENSEKDENSKEPQKTKKDVKNSKKQQTEKTAKKQEKISKNQKDEPNKEVKKDDKNKEMKNEPNKEEKNKPNKEMKNEPNKEVKNKPNKEVKNNENKEVKNDNDKEVKNNDSSIIIDDETKELLDILTGRAGFHKSCLKEGEDENLFLKVIIQNCDKDKVMLQKNEESQNDDDERRRKNYSTVQNFILDASNWIISIKQFIDDHQTEITYSKNILNVISVILKVMNPAYGLISVIRDLGFEFVTGLDYSKVSSASSYDKKTKGVASKAVGIATSAMENLGFALSELYEKSVDDFANKYIDDDYLRNKFTKAAKCLPDIIITLYDIYDSASGIGHHGSAVMKSKMTFKQGMERLNPAKNIGHSIDKTFDKMMDNKYYNNKMFKQQNMKPNDGHTFEMKNPPKPPPMTPPPSSSSAYTRPPPSTSSSSAYTRPPPSTSSSSAYTRPPPSAAAATPKTNIHVSFEMPSQPTQQNVNFANLLGNPANAPSSSSFTHAKPPAAASSTATPKTNIHASFEMPYQPTQQNVNFANLLGNPANAPSSSSSSSTFDFQSNYNFWNKYLNDKK